MTNRTRLNFDTSVLLNYLYASLPGELETDRGTTNLVDGDEYWTSIGGKAHQEFDALCERRHELYSDVVSFLLSGADSIFEYDPRGRDLHTSSNDRSHFRESVQMSWHDRDKREQLSLLRRINQDIQLYQRRLPDELLDDRFPKQTNDALLGELESQLAVAHDCEILVDAAEIADKHDVQTLVALDSDITADEHQKLFATILEDEYGDEGLVNVRTPSEL